MPRLPLKHRAQTIPPDTKTINDLKTKGVVDETLQGIQETNKNVYDDLSNIFGQLPQNGNPLYFGDPTVAGTWRIIVLGNNLAFQRLESSVWVEKMAVTP